MPSYKSDQDLVDEINHYVMRINKLLAWAVTQNKLHPVVDVKHTDHEGIPQPNIDIKVFKEI